jgi:hypothetical protein
MLLEQRTWPWKRCEHGSMRMHGTKHRDAIFLKIPTAGARWLLLHMPFDSK